MRVLGWRFERSKRLALRVHSPVLGVLLALAAGCCPKPANLMPVLMVTDGQHGEPAAGLDRLAERLTGRGEIRVDAADPSVLEGPTLADYRVLAFTAPAYDDLNAAARKAVLEFVRSGGGLVATGGALNAFADWPEWVDTVGGECLGSDGNAARACVALDVAHAVVMGLGGRFSLPDAPGLVGALAPQVEVLARSAPETAGVADPSRIRRDPQIWTHKVGDGRLVAVAFGRDPRAWQDEWFITLMYNAVRWAGRTMPDTQHNVLTSAETQEGYALLFNGQDLEGWTAGTEHWAVQDGELVGRANQLAADSFLIGGREYGDFVLRFSVKLPGGKGNSGVIVRCGRLPAGAVLGYEADVAAGRYGTISEEGGQRGVLAEGWQGRGEQVAVLDGWNDIVVRAVGDRITLALNGYPTAAYQVVAGDGQPRRGPIALELHRNMQMEVRFRDLRIQSLDK